MLRWLRRHQPSNAGLAILYWATITLGAFALLLLLFFQLDRFLPAMF